MLLRFLGVTMQFLRKALLAIAVIATVTVLFAFIALPGILDWNMNRVAGDAGPSPSAEALALHQSLTIGDLHADTLLWTRSPIERSSRGHVDLPRQLAGNFALQMYTTVTKTPRGMNIDSNSAEAGDNVTLLAAIQRWPAATRHSLAARALYQAERLHTAAAETDALTVITERKALDDLLARRAQGAKELGALLGTEGSHALDGDVNNVDVLYEAGFRMMSLQHFFDNKLGGSLHGESGAGLTEFGKQAVDRMSERGIMIDVAHSSEAVVRDVLARVKRPLIVSHTGFKGHCDTARNISDETMAAIANAGGLLGVGYWDKAVCAESITAVAEAIRYGIDQFGLEHIALGSDWDGTITSPIDASQIAHLTQALMDANLSETEIRAVMGGNMVRFLQENLPAS